MRKYFYSISVFIKYDFFHFCQSLQYSTILITNKARQETCFKCQSYSYFSNIYSFRILGSFYFIFFFPFSLYRFYYLYSIPPFPFYFFFSSNLMFYVYQEQKELRQLFKERGCLKSHFIYVSEQTDAIVPCHGICHMNILLSVAPYSFAIIHKKNINRIWIHLLGAVFPLFHLCSKHPVTFQKTHYLK